MNKIGSQEQLNNFRKPSLMARSNPIGLAEPSVKRDGYAVSRDGSFYRSSENMFENKPQKQVIHCYIMDLIAEKKEYMMRETK